MAGIAPISAVSAPRALGSYRAVDPRQAAVLAALRETDRKVRAHEQAHLAAAGPYATGGASYTFTTGPDGQQYAIGGEVPIDVSPEPGNPQATLQKARAIQQAANAPADPSPQDHAVASAAAQLEARAQAQLAKAYSSHQAAEKGTLLDLFA